jgi:hypothetical protein
MIGQSFDVFITQAENWLMSDKSEAAALLFLVFVALYLVGQAVRVLWQTS